MLNLFNNLIINWYIKYNIYPKIRICYLLNLSITNKMQLNALKIIDLIKSSINSNIIKYLDIFIIFINCKIS